RRFRTQIPAAPQLPIPAIPHLYIISVKECTLNNFYGGFIHASQAASSTNFDSTGSRPATGPQNPSGLRASPLRPDLFRAEREIIPDPPPCHGAVPGSRPKRTGRIINRKEEHLP